MATCLVGERTATLRSACPDVISSPVPSRDPLRNSGQVGSVKSCFKHGSGSLTHFSLLDFSHHDVIIPSKRITAKGKFPVTSVPVSPSLVDHIGHIRVLAFRAI